jgi:hypothetical protein
VKYHSGRLPKERIELVEQIYGWSWSPRLDQRNEDWKEFLEELRNFKAEHNTLLVPSDYVTENNFKLGYWVAKIRNKKSKLSKVECNELQLLEGWVWSASDARWELGFLEVSRFLENNSIYDISANTILENGYKLGNWVKHQRSHKRHNKLPLERQERLTALDGWVWVPQKIEHVWHTRYRELIVIQDREGKIPVISGLPKELYNWCVTQRTYFSGERLSADKVKKLERLNGWAWSSR